MMGNAAVTVAEVAGTRYLIGLDKGHKLEIRSTGSPPTVIESRPVTEFSAAIDSAGRLHVAAWLLSRHLMYYTSADGAAFTRSTLLKSDGGLRLKDCLVFADSVVSVAYVAETEYANTLVCYRYENGEWEGRRVVEVELPQRLTAWQFDGSPGGASIVYGVKEPGRTVVMKRLLSADSPPEVAATITGALSDFSALTSGGVRQACWLADGHLVTNGLRQSEEPWSRTWPFLKRGDNGVQCLWIENGMLCGMQLGSQRAMLRPANVRNPLPCMLALPGELHKAVVDGQTLKEPMLVGDKADRQQDGSQRRYPSGREFPQGGPGDVTLSEVVRNQAIYLTRMQESLSAMERNMLRMQAEVNRLNKEISTLLRVKEGSEKVEHTVRAAAVRQPAAPETGHAAIEEIQNALEASPQAESAPASPVTAETASPDEFPSDVPIESGITDCGGA